MNLRRPSLVEAITAEIYRRIKTGEYLRGEKIPPQKTLAQSLGVSPASLRGALDQLSLMGLIETKHGEGTFVKSTRPSLFVNHTMLLSDKNVTWELLEARTQIESLVVRMAARRAHKADINAMTALLSGADEDLRENRVDAFSAKDMDFHLMISRASKNRVMERILESLREPMYQLIRETYSVSPDSLEESASDHKQILGAIASHDVRGSQKRMEKHLRYSKHLVERYYRFAEPGILEEMHGSR